MVNKPIFFTASGQGQFVMAGILFILTSFCCPAADRQSGSFRRTAEKTLEETWKLIVKHYYRDESGNSRWREIYRNARPEILKSRSQAELVVSVNKMLAELGQSHTQLLPPVSSTAKKALSMKRGTTRPSVSVISVGEVKEKTGLAEAKKYAGKPAGIGIVLCETERRLCVLRVVAGSSADKAGIRTGDVIKSVRNLPFDLSGYSDIPWGIIAESMLTGNYGTPVTLTVENAEGADRQIVLKRSIPLGDWIKLGAMPALAGRVDSRILEGNVGYICITPYFPRQIMELRKLITGKLKNCSGIIIDLRNNPGGMMAMAPAMLGWLTDKELPAGTMKARANTLTLTAYPQPGAYTGPLAVLVNGGTCSTAEVFAAAVQDNKRGRVFGEKTSGKCLPSVFFALSTGYRLQTVFGDFIRAGGARIEKLGVKPDVAVIPTRKLLISGRDPVIDKARWALLSLSE